MLDLIPEQTLMTAFGWCLIIVGCWGVYQAVQGLRRGEVMNAPDYPGDWESFDRDRQSFLYWLNVLLYLVGGIGAIALGSAGLGLW